MADVVTSDETLPGTRLIRGRVVPGIDLTDARTREPLSPWAQRQRAASVLCFVHDSCARCEAYVRSLEEQDGEEMRVTGGRLLPVLAEGAGAATFLLPARAPAVVILDRYAAAWASYPAPDHEFPEPREVAATLWHLATMCPECGVSTWDG